MQSSCRQFPDALRYRPIRAALHSGTALDEIKETHHGGRGPSLGGGDAHEGHGVREAVDEPKDGGSRSGPGISGCPGASARGTRSASGASGVGDGEDATWPPPGLTKAEAEGALWDGRVGPGATPEKLVEESSRPRGW